MNQAQSPFEVQPQPQVQPAPPAAHQPGMGPGLLVVPARPTNTAAVIGFVLSLVGISLPALIVSAIAMRTTKDGAEAGHGLAVAGLVIGIIGTLTWTAIVAPPVLAFMALLFAGAASGGGY